MPRTPSPRSRHDLRPTIVMLGLGALGCAPLPATAAVDAASLQPESGAAPEPAHARAEAPAEIGAPADPRQALAGTYRARFVTSHESSCSQSWDLTTYRGELSVHIDAGGTASLELSLDAESIGGAWRGGPPPERSSYPPERCHWEGEAIEHDGGLRLALSRSSGNASACTPAFAVEGEGPEIELTCRADRRRLPYVPDPAKQGLGGGLGLAPLDDGEAVVLNLLTCSAAQRVVRMVHDLLDPSTRQLHLSSRARLQIHRDELAIGHTEYSVVALDR